jgi:prevent-host-death family protein
MKTKAAFPSVSDFAEDVHGYLEKLREEDMPMVLSVDGKPAVVVVDIRLYEFLAKTSQRELIEILEKRIKEIDRGEVESIPAEEVFRSLRRRFAKRKSRKQ